MNRIPRFLNLKNIQSLMVIANILLFVLAIVSFADSVWLFFLIEQFRIEYLVIGVLLLFLLALSKRWLHVLICCLGLVLNLIGMDVALFFQAPHARVVDKGVEQIRLLEMNVEYSNSKSQLAADLIENTNADIVVIEEFTPSWFAALSAVLVSYPNRVLVPRNDPYGNAVFSKLPIHNTRIAYFGPKNHPCIKTDIVCKNADVSLVHTHLQGPVSLPFFEMQKADANGAASLLSESGENAILCGDMNSASWCAPLRNVVKGAHLVDSRTSRVFQLSWPTIDKFLFPLLAIDHCFSRGQIQVTARKIGPYYGSDHFPLIIDFAVPTK